MLSTYWAPLLPKDIIVQLLASLFHSLEAPISISLTASICDSIQGAQDGLIALDSPAIKLLDHLTTRILTEKKKLPKETKPLQV